MPPHHAERLKVPFARLLGRLWCYYHGKRHRGVSAGRPPEPLPVPQIESAHGIQIALAQVLNEIKSPFADTHRAGVFLNGLQLAAQLLDRTTPPQPAEGARVKEEPGVASVEKSGDSLRTQLDPLPR